MAAKAANLQITNTDRYDFEDNYGGYQSQDDDEYVIDGEYDGSISDGFNEIMFEIRYN